MEGEVGFEGGYDVVLRRSAGSYPERGSSATNVTRTLVRKCRGPSGGSKLTKFSNTKCRAAREVAPFSQCHWRQDRSPTASGGNRGIRAMMATHMKHPYCQVAWFATCKLTPSYFTGTSVACTYPLDSGTPFASTVRRDSVHST